MLKQNIRSLSRDLNTILHYRSFLTITQELNQFYTLLLSLHADIKQYLRQQTFPSKTRLTEDSSFSSLSKSVNLTTNQNIQHQSELVDNSYILREPLSLLQIGAVKVPQKGRVKLASSMTMDKNIQSLMENIKLIILYQNQVEKLIQPINNQLNMAEICLYQKSFDFEGRPLDNKENERQSFDINNLNNDIKRVIEDCKNIQQVHQNFQASRGNIQDNSRQSQSESNDKKSLLTSMLLQNQGIESDLGNSATVKKVGRKPVSETNMKIEINKRLLKQFDFENYRVERNNGRRERKPDMRACGQCTQCTIF